MTEHAKLVAWRGGKGIPRDELLGAMGPGLAPGSEAPFVPAPRWSDVAAAIATRLLRAAAKIRPFQEREANIYVNCVTVMAVGGEHDEGRRLAAIEAAAFLNTTRIMADRKPPSVEAALSWFPRALAWATRHARLDRKCPYKLADLAAEAAAHHAELARVQGDDPEAARRAEEEAQRRDVEAALEARGIEPLE